MAYSSVISLKQTLERFRFQPRIKLLPELQIDSIYQDLCYIEKFLNDVSSWQRSKRVDDLGRQIKELVEKLEDLIESHISDQFLSSSGNESLTVVFSQPLMRVILELNVFTKTLMRDDAVEFYTEEYRPEPTSLSVADFVSSRVDVSGMVKMVGMDHHFKVLRDWLTQEKRDTELIVIPLVGMAGIGKTALAKRAFQDPLVADQYDHLLFLPIGPHYHFNKCLLLALSQVTGYSVDDEACQMGENELAVYLSILLYNWRYLIVLDDVWETQVWDDFKPCFPDNNNRSRIILTTRMVQVGVDAKTRGYYIRVPFLNDDESWNLLRKTVFTAEESCHHQLEKVGRQIAKNCEGLPLAIIEISKILRKADKTVDTWKKVAEDEDPLNIGAGEDNPITKTLSLSYDRLSLHLKMCFLYIGLFPKDNEIPKSQLIKLWISEGFIRSRNYVDENMSLGEMATNCLFLLWVNSLVLLKEYSSFSGIKYCKMHFVYRALCVSKAWNENLFHVINKYVDSFPQEINFQRRLCFRNKAIVGFKQVQSSIESVLGARSLLFFGRQDQRPLRVYLGYRLLRVLHALAIRFYEFPHTVVELFLLRYIAITYGGREIPPSISRLWNLETLIVHPHHFIKYPDGPMYLPVEIWKLCRLRHLECVGFDLPDPSNNDSSVNLERLLTLSGVSTHSCTKGVLARVPNLMKLGVRIVRGLTLDAATIETSFDFFGDVTSLCDRIESFSCVVLSHDHRSQVVPSIPEFHVNITKINLSGCGIRWEHMKCIGRLPNLRVLKLKLYAFRGTEWKTIEGGFPRLEFLLLQDLDIEHWRVENGGHFPSLIHLIVMHCYKLREIPCEIGDIPTLRIVQVHDCSPRVYQRYQEHIKNTRSCYPSPSLWLHLPMDD